MKRGVLIGVFAVLLFSLIFCLGLTSAFSGSGSGTAGSPYNITNCTQLQEVQDSLSSYYMLGNDINCSDTVNWNSGAGFDPIGTAGSGFYRTFDGKGRTISGLYINRTGENNVGLFAYLGTFGNAGTLRNFSLTGVNITGDSQVAAVVPAWVDDSHQVRNIYVTGNVRALGNYAGGIFGKSDSEIHVFYVSFSGNVSGVDEVGGIAGHIITATTDFKYVYSEGNVSGRDYVGGIFGAGGDGFSADNAYSKANVGGRDYIGGLAGGQGVVGGHITNSYATGNVSGNNDVGGLIGKSGVGPLSGSFATGKVNGNTNVGALVGELVGVATISGSYWYNHTDSIPCVGSVVNECENKSKSSVSYFYGNSSVPMSGWDFTTIWNSSCGGGYPILLGVGGLQVCTAASSTGSLNASLITPTANTTVTQGNSFSFSSNVSCSSGGCGNVSAYLDPAALFEMEDKPLYDISETREVDSVSRIVVVVLLILAFFAVLLIAPSNKKAAFAMIFMVVLVGSVFLTFKLTGHVSYNLVSTTVGVTPFYTTSANPQNCGTLNAGENCTNTWTVYASGSAASYEFYVAYNSTTAGVSEANTSSVYITINVPAATTTTSSSSEGSGRAQKIYEISDDEFTKGYRHEVYAGDMFRFNFMGGVHTVKVISIRQGSIRFVVASDPITLDANQGETKEVDINSDGTNDMNVELISAAVGGVADIVLKRIIIEQPLMPAANNSAKDVNVEQPLMISETGKLNLVWIIAALAIIIIILALSRVLVSKIKSKRLRN